MTFRTFTYCLWLLTATLLPPMLTAQDPASPRERIEVCTDRSIYACGEPIRISALVQGPDHENRSGVFYCELINHEGDRLAAGKYPYQHSSGSGCLAIPEEVITGSYYLKSYTRPMRNGNTGDYHYLLLKIINPEKADVLNPLKTDETLQLPGDSTPPLSNSSLQIFLDDRLFLPREEVKIDLAGLENAASGKYCLTVAPEAACLPVPVVKVASGDPAGDGQYYSESQGISLTGNVNAGDSGQGSPGVKVNLSILGEKDLMSTMTDSSGRFFFALPALEGSRDIFLSAAARNDQPLVINIENDFCSRPVSLPAPVFTLDSAGVETAYRLAVNHRVASRFYEVPITGPSGPDREKIPFYGEPSQVLLMDKYIELPTLEEYFNELPVAVKVRKSQGRKLFRFNSTQVEMTIYDPLVLIDWVAVEDMDRILALSPREIDRIELVNAPYIKGNITYGGIISLISKDNDFGGIDLPASGTFIRYTFYTDCHPVSIPENPPDKMPDPRNTIYWDPDVKPDKNGQARISFNAPDTPGRYAILVRELGSGDQVIRSFETGEGERRIGR